MDTTRPNEPDKRPPDNNHHHADHDNMMPTRRQVRILNVNVYRYFKENGKMWSHCRRATPAKIRLNRVENASRDEIF